MPPTTAQTAGPTPSAKHPNGSLGLTVPDALLDDLAARVAERLALLIAPAATTPWLTVAEAAEHLRCKPKRIYDLISQRRIPTHHDGGRVLLRRDELDTYLLGEADTPLTPATNGQRSSGISVRARTVSPHTNGPGCAD